MANRSPTGSELESRLLSARAELERRLLSGALGAAEELRATFPDVWADPDAALELAYAEYVFRAARGESPSRADWYRRFPEWRARLERLFALYDASEAPAAPPPTSGGPAGSGYELLGEIGRGGMGIVYMARQRALNRVVALKMLRGGVLFRPEDAARIGREAELVARLQHPNIVQVFETGELDGVPFFSLEFVAGGSLEDALADARRRGTDPVTPRAAAALVETLARAVQYAHEQYVVHRDLKPANILLGKVEGGRGRAEGKSAGDGGPDSAPPSAFHLPPWGVPKIADFGLAAITGADDVTHTGAVLGTPSYMAPEQTTGLAGAVGPPADVYALGGILYRLLAGRPPFEGGTALETLDLVRHTDPVPPARLRPNLPRDLETVCLKCLRKGPEKRYASAAELGDDLARFLRGEPVRARPVSLVERGAKWARRNPVVAVLGAAVVVLAVSGSALAWGRYEEREVARETESRLLRSKYQDAETARQNEHRQRTELEGALAAERIARARAHWNGDEIGATRRVLAEVSPERRGAEWNALRAEAYAEVSSEPMPLAVVGRFVPSPDGKRLALFRGNSTEVTVIDTASFKPVVKLDVRTYPQTVAFRDDSNRLVVLPQFLNAAEQNQFKARNKRDYSARVGTWDLATSLLTAEHDIGLNDTTSLGGNGHRGATASGTRVTVWDSGTGAGAAEFTERDRPIQLVLDHRGARVAAFSGSRVTVREVASGEVVDVIETKSALVSRFNPSGDVFVWLSATTTWTTPTGETFVHLNGRDLGARKDLFRVLTPYGSRGRFVFSPNGRAFAFLDGNLIRVHDAQTGLLLATLRGHATPLFDLAFAPDGKHLYSIGGALKTWDITPWVK